MSGLLDKAKSTSKDEDKTQPKTTSGLLKKADSAPQKTKHSSQQSAVDTSQNTNPDGPDIPMIMNIAGWVVIVIGGLLSLQGGGFGFIVVLSVLVIGIGCIIQSQRMTSGISQLKTGISVGLAFIIAVGPYAAVMIVPTNAAMAVTEVSLDEEDNELSFVVRGSFSEADAKILADNSEVWSGSKTLSNDRATFYIPISTIFSGNSLDYTANKIKDYTIEVTSSDGQTSTTDIDTSFTTREVLNSATRISKVLKTNNDGSSTNTVTDGITIEAIVGLFSPTETAQDDGGHSLTNLGLIAVSSDYTFNMVIKKESGGSGQAQVVYSNMPTVMVDGLDASWSSPLTGTQTGKTSGWLGMPGTAQNNLNTEYLQKDDFYDSSGCYTFEVTISNQYYTGDSQSTYTSSNSWELDWHPEDSTQDGQMTTC